MRVSLYDQDCDEDEAEAAFNEMEARNADCIGLAIWGDDLLISTTLDLDRTEELLAHAFAAIRQRRAN